MRRPLHHRMLIALLWTLAGMVGAARGQTPVEFASLDQRDGRPVLLKAFWLPAPKVAGRIPAVALFHGCGGPYERNGRLSQRMRDYAALLHQQGMHALVVDSLTPRGETQLCTQRIGARAVTQANRRLDALAALAWLAQREEVDPGRIGMIGWSNGGSTVLAATNLRQREVAAQTLKPAFAVAFYPSCEAELKRGFESTTRLLLLVGEADDWTSAAPCHRLAQSAAGLKPAIESYAGAYHGFDSAAPVRLRRDVPGGVNPGQGVHVGGDAQALRLSRERLLRFLAEQ
jgi:dienelactone hydrolase